MMCSADLSAGDYLRQYSSLTNFIRESDETSLRVISCVHKLEARKDLKSFIEKSDKSSSHKSETNSSETSIHNFVATERLSTDSHCCSNCTTFHNVREQPGLKHNSLPNSKSSEFSVICNDSAPTEKSLSGNSLDSCVKRLDVTDCQLNELEDRLQTLVSDLIKEKSDNYLLKRSFLVAKKVLQNETGSLSTEDIDKLLMKSSENGWKGQQEIILELKKKVRTLCSVIKSLEPESDLQKGIRSLSQMRKRPESSKNNFNKANVCRYKELEGEEILKNEEKYKKILISSTDSMKNALETRRKRNEELINEMYVLRERLSLTFKNTTTSLPNSLLQIEKKMKSCLEAKFEERHKLESLREQISNNSRKILDLKEKIRIERKTAADKKAMLTSLKKNGTSFCTLSLELREVKCKQAVITKKLEDMLKEYGKMALRVGTIFTPAMDGRISFSKLNLMHKQNTTNKDYGKKYCTRKTKTEENSMPAMNFKRITFTKSIDVYKIKLAKYKEKFHYFESQNFAKQKQLHDTICETKEDLSIVLRNRESLLKLATDINVLKMRRTKISKVVSQLPKRKLVRKKNSCPQLTEILDAGRMHFDILNLESKFLKTLIKQIFVRRRDDQELLENFFKRNKNLLLKYS